MAKEKKKKPKKDGQLVIRIGKEERDEFVALCEEIDTTAARELRHYIRLFLEKGRSPLKSDDES